MQHTIPSERSTYRDPDTGATVIQWTKGPHKNQHLYFTSFSVTADDRWLAFISDRDGNPNLHAIDRRDGTIRRLSANAGGLLRSYVYPQGGLRGLSKASPCLDPHRNRLFYIRDDILFAVDLDAETPAERRLCELPQGWYGGFTHISPDGKWLCVPCTDPQAFANEKTQWEQLKTVPMRMARLGLVSRILLVEVESGQLRTAAETPFWVTHVQFDPAGSGRIVFNREGDAPDRENSRCDRIWCLEPTGAFRRLAPQPAGEWRSHENWSPDGRSIVYHGGRGGKAFVAARTWEGELLHETNLGDVEFWHATAAQDGRRLVVDRRDGMISLLDPDADCATNLCRHDTTYEDQDAHAHPITTPSGKSVVFTSIRTGTCNVYEVPLADIR
jgi:Tol biopolymer transport system component